MSEFTDHEHTIIGYFITQFLLDLGDCNFFFGCLLKMALKESAFANLDCVCVCLIGGRSDAEEGWNRTLRPPCFQLCC